MTGYSTAVRYVALSDLHLGAGYSMLTDEDAEGVATPRTPSATLVAFGKALRATLPPLSDDQLPQLILLGDVFDLSFATPQDAMMAFQRLIEVLFDPDQPQIFSPTIIYVPGNHDHREWRVMRDALFLDAVTNQVGSDIPDDQLITGLFDDSRVVCQIATVVARKTIGGAGITVETGYPNIGIRHDDRWVVLHHGHYTESTYTMMSKAAWYLNGTHPADTLAEIERLNGPWIDFGWSNTGDQGAIGTGIFNLYETIQDPAASHATIQRLAKDALAAISKKAPIHSSTKITSHGFSITAGGLTTALLDLTLARAAQSERTSVDRVLTESSLDGIRNYLGGPVLAQLREAGWNDSDHLTFVFGHTHKPFADELLTPDFRHTVQVFNTGGWVIDHPCLSPTQGGAAIMIHDHANVAALRLFNDPIDGSVGSVRATGTGSPHDADNPLLAALHAVAAEQAAVWAGFSTAVLADIMRRTVLLRDRYFDPTNHPPAIDRRTRSVR